MIIRRLGVALVLVLGLGSVALAQPDLDVNLNAQNLSLTGISSHAAQVVTVDAATTFAVTSGYVQLSCTGAETINTITAGVTGMTLMIEHRDSDCTIADDDFPTAGDAVDLANGNLVGANGLVVMLYFDGTSWIQNGGGVSGVIVSGTPANDQLAIFTDANTIEGDPDLTWNATTLALVGAFTATSVDVGGTVLYGSRAITVDTGGVLNVVLASAAGDDFTIDTNKLVVEGDTGRVGIGTSTPNVLLELNATSPVIRLQAAAGGSPIYRGRRDAASSGQTLMGFSGVWNTNEVVVIRAISGADTGNKDDGHLTFLTSASGPSLGERMRVTNTGNVGIGASVPATLLEVENGNATTGIQISNTATDGDPALAFALSGTPIITMGVDDGDGDAFKIGTTAIGTDTRFEISTAGVVTFPAAGDTLVTGTYTREEPIEVGSSQQGATAPTPVTTGTTRGLAFDADAELAFFSFEVPGDWDAVSDMMIDVEWSPQSGTALADTETVIWSIDYRSVAVGETIVNGTLVTATATYTQSGAGTDNELIETILTIDFDDVNQPLAAGDHIFVQFSRNFSGDTYVSDAVVHEWDMVYQSIGLPTGG